MKVKVHSRFVEWSTNFSIWVKKIEQTDDHWSLSLQETMVKPLHLSVTNSTCQVLCGCQTVRPWIDKSLSRYVNITSDIYLNLWLLTARLSVVFRELNSQTVRWTHLVEQQSQLTKHTFFIYFFQSYGCTVHRSPPEQLLDNVQKEIEQINGKLLHSYDDYQLILGNAR